MAEDAKDQSRRRFLKLATVAMGGMIGLVASIPLVRYLLFPVRRRIVDSPDAPIDVMGANELVAGGAPVKVALRVSGVRNAWNVSDGVAVGSAWVMKDGAGKVTALSATCPHLGCAIDFNTSADEFRCPCHKSAFDKGGEKRSGPAKRGLDPLPVQVTDGRVRVTFKRFLQDVADRIEV
jgi:Rieske Fe-S protein